MSVEEGESDIEVGNRVLHGLNADAVRNVLTSITNVIHSHKQHQHRQTDTVCATL